MLRFVLREGGPGLEVDPTQVAGGRGLYVCANRSCIELACQRAGSARRAKDRRREVPRLDARRLYDSALEAVRRSGDEYLLQLVQDGRARRSLEAGDGWLVKWNHETWRIQVPRSARRMEQIEQLLAQLLAQ